MPSPLRSLRIDDELWRAAQDKADLEGRDGGVSEVIRELLSKWVTRPPRKR
ncbi:Uncharacterised protein [Mycobacteroides abscessus subsp. massiliense]|nr:DNA binding protein [Mycobacterium phage prophiT46-2]SKL48717.1 Uncharacterised protein [Mycobacteroides abscessus subsp. massiliense]